MAKQTIPIILKLISISFPVWDRSPIVMFTLVSIIMIYKMIEHPTYPFVHTPTLPN